MQQLTITVVDCSNRQLRQIQYSTFSFFFRIMSFLFKHTEEEYQLSARLSGTAGPLNCLAFTQDGKLLASGGDEEKLHLWDVDKKRANQVIGDEMARWGQITCVKWLSGISDNGEALCFGTGRGLVLIYLYSKEVDRFKELSSTAVLPFNEPVEAIDHDINKGRLVLSGHTGKIKLFHLEKNGTLLALWSKNWNDSCEGGGVIPRGVRFTGNGEDILIFGLESGVITCKSTTSGADKWTKVLKSSIGNICFSDDQKLLLVDNLAKGFDLYNYPHSSPSDSFPIPREKAFVQEAVFLEAQTSVACGSDHGQIHIFSVGTSKCLQKLKHGSRKTLVQVLAACSTRNQHLIASGTHENKPMIHIWEKRITGHQEQSRACRFDAMMLLVLLNVLMMFFFAILWLSENGGQNFLTGRYRFGMLGLK